MNCKIVFTVLFIIQLVFGQMTLKGTHYWDCNGAGCDSTTLQPWDQTKYISPFGYAPQDPNNFGGPMYGEKIWMVGAASDILAAELGNNDPCCGRDHDSKGCGKCILVTNPDAVEKDWKVIVMKKNRCPPSSLGCNTKHMDFAVPGYDNAQFSTANICENPRSGFTSKQQSFICGTWNNLGSDTRSCFSRCAQLPGALRAGCEMFSLWGWKRGDPQLNYQVVACPPRFKQYIQSLFGANGVTNAFVPTTYTLKPSNPIPTNPTPTPTNPTGASEIAFQNCNEYWVQFQIPQSYGGLVSAKMKVNGVEFAVAKSSWDQSTFAQGPPIRIPTGTVVEITVSTPSKTFTVTTNWLQWGTAKQNVLELDNEIQEVEDLVKEALNEDEQV